MTWPKGPWAQSLRKMGKREKWVPRNVQLAAGPALGSLHSQLAQLASRFETWTKMMQHRFFGALVGGSTSSRFAAGSTCLAHRPQPLHTRSAPLFFVHAAHKKGGGSTKNGRDSNSQRRGIKVYGGQPVKAGGIIFRQVGSEVGCCACASFQAIIVVLQACRLHTACTVHGNRGIWLRLTAEHFSLA